MSSRPMQKMSVLAPPPSVSRPRTMSMLEEKAEEKAVQQQIADDLYPEIEDDEIESKKVNNAVLKIQKALLKHRLRKKDYEQVWVDSSKALGKQYDKVDFQIANRLGIDPRECDEQAFRKLRNDVAEGNLKIEAYWDKVGKEGERVNAVKKKKVRLEITANGMELMLTHTSFGDSTASLPSSSGSAPQLSCALCHSPQPHLHDLLKGEEPEDKARRLLKDLLHLTAFELEYFHIGMGVFERCDEECDNPSLPGLTTVADIMLVPICVEQPLNLPKLGLPHGASFSLPGRCGVSLWNWPHIEASPLPAAGDLRRMIGRHLVEKNRRRSQIHKSGAEDEEDDIELGESSEDESSALQWICQSVLRNDKVRASWLRRPVSGRGPMLLLLHGLHEELCSSPVVLEIWFGKRLDAKDEAARNISDALGDSAARIIGDVMSQSSQLHEAVFDGCMPTQREWHVVELSLPGSVWGSDCRAGEASVHSLCELVRRSYDAEMCIRLGLETPLDENQVSDEARSRAGEDAKGLLADLLGGRGPLAALMSVTNLAAGIPGDTKSEGSSEILNAPFNDMVDQLKENDPLPRRVCEKLPGVSAAGYRRSLSEELIIELQDLSAVLKKLTARRWYKKNPWHTRCCVIHGMFDIGHVLVGGLRQLWVAGLSCKHPCVDNALRDLADFGTSLLLEGCQLPVCESDMSSIMDESTDFSISDLADWMEADKHHLEERLTNQVEERQAGIAARRFSMHESISDHPGSVGRRSEVLFSDVNPVDDITTWERKKNSERSSWAPQRTPSKKLSFINQARSRNSLPEMLEGLDRGSSRKRTRQSGFNDNTKDSKFASSPGQAVGQPSRTTSAHPRGKLTRGRTSLEADEKIAIEEREKAMLKAYGRRHKALVVPGRADARAAYLEARDFSQAFAEQLPDALAGDGLGPPPAKLQPGPRRWAWELQRLVIAFAADRLGASHEGVFDQVADRYDAGILAARRTAAVMIPLILATVGFLRRVPLWQRPWVLVHATCLSRKLVEVLTQVADISLERHARGMGLRQHVGLDNGELSSELTSLCTSRFVSQWPAGSWLPQVRFAKGHRLWVVNPNAEEADKTPVVAGIVTSSSDSYFLDDFRGELDIQEAVPVLGLPCANLGMDIEQGRMRRRLSRPPNPGSCERPAACRKKAFNHITKLMEKAGRCMTGKVLDATAIYSSQVSVQVNNNMDLTEAEDFTFTCGNFTTEFGYGHAKLYDDMRMERIASPACALELLDRPARRPLGGGPESGPRKTFLEAYVKYTWSYRSFDDSVTIFGTGPVEAKSCLQKLAIPTCKVERAGKLQRDGLRATLLKTAKSDEPPTGETFPGTLTYMEYRAEVAIDSFFVEGQLPEEALAEIDFPGVHAIVPPSSHGRRAAIHGAALGVSDSDANLPSSPSPRTPKSPTGQRSGSKEARPQSPKPAADRRSGSKNKDKRTLVVQFTFAFHHSEDIDIYPAGARLRMFHKDNLCGAAGTIISLCESGEYLLRMDGGSHVVRFDPCPWNCEPAGVYRYDLHQKLMIYDSGRWLNGVVVNILEANCHEVEVPSTYRRVLKVDLCDSNHSPAWLSVLEFERAAWKYAGVIRACHGFLADPVSGSSLDILTLPCSITFFGSKLGQVDALPELLSILDPATDRDKGGLEARGVVVWGAQSIGKTTLAKRLAVTCTYKVGGYLPIMVPVQDIIHIMGQEVDPLDSFLWDRYGGAGRNLEIYRLLRQALYCRRAIIIFDEADAHNAKFISLLAFFQNLVDLGHRAVLFARPPPEDNTLRLGSLSSLRDDHQSGQNNCLSVQNTLSSVQLHEDLKLEAPATKESPPARQLRKDLGLDAPAPAAADSLHVPADASPLAPTAETPVITSQYDCDAAASDDGTSPRPPTVARQSTNEFVKTMSLKLDKLVTGREADVRESAKSPSTPSSTKPFKRASVATEWKNTMKAYAKATTAAKDKAMGVLLKESTPPLLELEMGPLTPETQREAVAVRCGQQDGEWFREHLHAAQDISEHPFGLMLLIGYHKATPGSWTTSSHRMSKYEEEDDSSVVKMLESSLTMCLNQALNKSLSKGISQQLCNTDVCLRVLEIIALEIQRRGSNEILKSEIEDILSHEADEHELKLAWDCLSLAVEDQRLPILQGLQGLQDDHDLCTPVRFIHGSLQDYFLAQCWVHYASSQRQTGLPALEQMLFEQSWARFFRFFFEIMEIHQVTMTLDFSGQKLPPERFDQLIDLFNSRHWRYPCVKLELSGCDQVPGSKSLQRLLQSSIEALQGFSIRCYPLEAEGVTVFAHTLSQRNHSLTMLDLRNCSVGPEGVRILCEALANNVLLIHLNLAGNAIGEPGAAHVGHALKTNTKLQFLELENNGMASSGAAALSECAHGCSHSALKYLGVARNRIADEGAEHIVELMLARWCLQELDIAGNGIFDLGFQRLAKGVVDETPLQQLCLSGNEGGPDGMWHISKALRNLQGSSALRRIHLDHTRLGLGGISHLAEVILEGATLECLELRGNRLGSKGVCRLANALRVAYTRGFGKLRRLGLCANTCMDAGAIGLARVLKDDRGALEDLDLSENEIGDVGATKLAIALRAASSRLRHLKLNSNHVSHEGVEAIAKALVDKQNKALVERKHSKAVVESLDLSGNILGDRGAIAMAAALAASLALHTVELQRSRISRPGALALADAVQQRKTIKRIGLHGNFVGELLQPYVEDLCKIRVGLSADVAAAMHSSQSDVQMKWVTELKQEVADQRKRLGLPKVQPMSRYRELLEGIIEVPESPLPARRHPPKIVKSPVASSPEPNSPVPMSPVLSRRSSKNVAMTRWSRIRSSLKEIVKLPDELPMSLGKARPTKSGGSKNLPSGRKTSASWAPPSHNTSIASTKASTETSRSNI